MPDSWQPTLDGLRPPRGRTEPFWEWRRRPPQPVVFRALDKMDSSRFRSQGYSAVLAAYGWDDIDVPPYTTPTSDAEYEDIDRLFLHNAERVEEERLRGIGEVKKAKKGGGRKRSTDAPRLPLDDASLEGA